MIQRIQTIFLLISGLVLAGLFKFPWATAAPTDSGLFADGMYNIHDHQVMLITCIATCVMIFISILLFKNRRIQFITALLSIFLICLLTGFTIGKYMKTPIENVALGAGVSLPVVSVIFLLLGMRFIKKDDKLVKSMDRLR